VFSRPWLALLRRHVLIHRRLLAFILTFCAVLLGWSAFVSRPPMVSTPAAPISSAPTVRSGFVRMPVRFADGEMATLLHPGDRIQLWATDPRAGTSRVVARDVDVLAVPDPAASGVMATSRGRLIVVGIRVTEVNKVTISSVEGFLTYALDR
jgi:hypothetical protein